MSHLIRSIAAVAAAGGLVVTGIAVAAPANAASTDVVINEVYGGGGNNGLTLTNDFIELKNLSSAAVDVDGWTLEYRSASGSSGGSTTLAGSIAAGATYLVQESGGSNGTVALPAPDATGTLALSASNGIVVLHHDAATVDLVGYGTATVPETAPAPGLNAATSDSRTGADTDDNAADFRAGIPTPTNAAGQTVDLGPGDGGGTPPTPGDVRIHDIQGDSWVSPLDDHKVQNVPGIVTAVRNTGSSRGYWIQDPTPMPTPPRARASSSSRTPRPSRSATPCSSPARSRTTTRSPTATRSPPRPTSRPPRSAARACTCCRTPARCRLPSC